MLAFAMALPALRRRIARDLSAHGLPRRKVIAAVVQLLEKTLIRVGNDEYARDNNSFGLTTMRNKHVRVSKSTLRFRFKGKGGKSHDIAFNDSRLARIVRRCQDLPGHELFGYMSATEFQRRPMSEQLGKAWHVRPGEPFPMGATWDGRGTNFSLFSEVAERVELCLFDRDGHETRVDLPEQTAFCWHGGQAREEIDPSRLP